MIIRFWDLLRRLAGCRHDHTYRERDRRTGKLRLICDTCGKAFPVDITDPKRAKRLQKRLDAAKAGAGDRVAAFPARRRHG